jgi:4-alpha-glucanotransferase
MMKTRSSGILLPVQSLPSNFGIGDLGPAAREFVQFLHAAGQHVWQILPVTPTEAEHGHSPYHSPSAFAFNPLLISPEQMAEHGFISRADLPAPVKTTQSPDRIDYDAAWAARKDLFSRAFELHRKDSDFAAFCEKNAYWLHDYALFDVLARQYRASCWQKWSPGLVRRRPDALAAAARQMTEPVARACFLQYLFYRQWTDFRDFCAQHQIRVMGDMPIYVPLQSADVWRQPHLFNLDQDFSPVAVSGVPPDYFSSTGQLWNHPVYNWEAHEKQEFDWWVRRIQHHLHLFDLLRVDHFRHP